MVNSAKVSAVLKAGGVALLPTDTVYGLAASPLHPQAVQKIFTLKNRPDGKNLPIFVADSGQLAALGVRIDERVEKLLQSRWVPGPLTLILAVDPARSPHWLQGRHELAVRIPDDAFLLSLLRSTGPLLATSANKSGEDTPAQVATILEQLTSAPDITIDDGPRTGTSSTLINCQTAPFKVQRRGALTPQALDEIMAI